MIRTPPLLVQPSSGLRVDVEEIPVPNQYHMFDSEKKNNNLHDLLSCQHVIFSGGGLRCVFHLIAMIYLETISRLSDISTPSWLEQVKGYAGSSGGAVIGLLMTLNVDPLLALHLILQLPFASLYKSVPITNWLSDKAIFSGTFLDNLLTGAMLNRCGRRNITFAQLRIITGKSLVVRTVNLSHMKLHCFCDQCTPNANVIDAVIASTSIPFVLSPAIIEDCQHVDGGLLQNTPVAFFEFPSLMLKINFYPDISDADSLLKRFLNKNNNTEVTKKTRNCEDLAFYLRKVFRSENKPLWSNLETGEIGNTEFLSRISCLVSASSEYITVGEFKQQDRNHCIEFNTSQSPMDTAWIKNCGKLVTDSMETLFLHFRPIISPTQNLTVLAFSWFLLQRFIL